MRESPSVRIPSMSPSMSRSAFSSLPLSSLFLSFCICFEGSEDLIGCVFISKMYISVCLPNNYCIDGGMSVGVILKMFIYKGRVPKGVTSH